MFGRDNERREQTQLRDEQVGPHQTSESKRPIKPIEIFLNIRIVKWFGHCLKREHNHGDKDNEMEW